MTVTLSRATPVAARVAAPRLRPGLLDRPRLVARMHELSLARLTLVCAPAGSGKTTLLGAWAATESRPLAWVSLASDDCRPPRFAQRVAEAVGARRAPWPAALVNDLAERADDLVLVLDGYEGDVLEPLLDVLPDNVHVVVAARTAPPLRLPLRRARGELGELGPPDLRFDLDEIVEVVRRLTNVALDRDEAVLLSERTDGWPAGVHLAALSLRAADDPSRFVREFHGSNRHVADYLREEVLERHPADVRDFLLHTSVLERLSTPLCDAARATGFVDRYGTRHRLFAEMLEAELELHEPALARELRARIACEQIEPRDEGVAQALAYLVADRADEARDTAPMASAEGAAVHSLACDRLGLYAEAAASGRASAAAAERDGTACELGRVAHAAVLARAGETVAAEERFESVVRACTHEPFVRALAELLLARLRAPRDTGSARALVRRARAAAGGESGLVGALADEVERELGVGARTVQPRQSDLTGAELRVVRLLSTQLTQREIASELFLSLNTVKTHSRSIYRKLGASSRDDAVSSARALNLV